MKTEIIQKIDSRLEELGIKRTESNTTDVLIKTILLDASYKGGKSRIEYEVNALMDDKNKTIFFYELLKESGVGTSFKADLETTFQNGLSLSRKVKSIKYNPDGKSYEYEFNLGAVSKIFKEVASEYQYDFKVVLSKNKAIYFDSNKKSLFQKIFNKTI